MKDVNISITDVASLKPLVSAVFEAVAAKCPSRKPMASLFVETIREVAEDEETLRLVLALYSAKT